MASVQDWLNTKFIDWEKAQGRKQSYYSFARFLEVSQSGLGQWMIGNGAPSGDDLLAIASKLGPEIYDVMGLPRPNTEAQRVTVSFASLPPDIRQALVRALVEVEATLRRERLRPDAAEARQPVLDILAKWGFRYTR